jgi:hypothetical protein
MKALAANARPPRRTRKPSLESQVRQLLKAGLAVGVQIAVTVEGDKVTATPTRGMAPANREGPPMGEPPDAPSGRS